jgi:hypothetical protein
MSSLGETGNKDSDFSLVQDKRRYGAHLVS